LEVNAVNNYLGFMPSRAPRAPRGRPRPRSYHHGDLKAALVDAAVEILRAQGPQALTLRAVARRVGVSQAAPYRHFADRRALVAAVAEQGFRRLQQAMLARMHTAQEGGRVGLKQVALAYVEFGLANPAEYRVMFGPEVAITDDLPELRKTARSVLGFVAEGIRQLQDAGLVGAGDPWLIAVTIWSTVHGLVMLTLDRQTAGVAPNVDALVEEATRIMMFGMAGRTG
jgi:AcrR family transcriptional regulator